MDVLINYYHFLSHDSDHLTTLLCFWCSGSLMIMIRNLPRSFGGFQICTTGSGGSFRLPWSSVCYVFFFLDWEAHSRGVYICDRRECFRVRECGEWETERPKEGAVI